MKKIKVCFCILSADKWLGGVNYFENLIRAVHLYEQDRIDLVVILSHDAPESIKNMFKQFRVIQTPFLSNNLFFRILGKILKLSFGRNIFLERLIKSHGVDMISHLNPLGYKSKIPFLPWIPDFQHLHLPHMFSIQDRNAREKDMLFWINRSPSVLLSSNSARQDLCSFSPSNCNKSRVLQFVSSKMLDVSKIDTGTVLSKYNIKKPFFIVPNQYWRHKNHIVLIKAVGALLKSNVDVLVVTTGCTSDHRDPNYFQGLGNLLEKECTTESYLILGAIPYAHLSVMMRESLAVINPSLFEGWSTTVEEAKSLGKKIILSDINVHREQSPPRALFFDPNDHLRLAEHMSGVMSSYYLDEELLSASTAASIFSASYERFAKCYADIALEFLSLSS